MKKKIDAGAREVLKHVVGDSVPVAVEKERLLKAAKNLLGVRGE